MIISRRLYIVINKDVTYRIAADSLDEAIAIIRKWRKDCDITSIQKISDVVLIKEDVGL